MVIKVSRSRPGRSVVVSPEHAADDARPHPMRPQCPCCAPQADFKRPSQRLADRLAALRERGATQPD